MLITMVMIAIAIAIAIYRGLTHGINEHHTETIHSATSSYQGNENRVKSYGALTMCQVLS